MERISVNCCPYEKYMEEYGFPKGVEVEHHPWNGQPFSEYYILTRNGKSVQIAFGVGGKYPQYVNEAIEQALS